MSFFNYQPKPLAQAARCVPASIFEIMSTLRSHSGLPRHRASYSVSDILAFSRSKDQRFGGAARCVPSGNVVRRAAYLTHVVATASQKSEFIEPCRPSKAIRPPSGPSWAHEIKHDGFRLMVRRESSRVRSFTRGGYDWADRFPAIVQAASRIKAQFFLIDGEVVVCRDDGLSDSTRCTAPS
jgi:hypothetical protein